MRALLVAVLALTVACAPRAAPPAALPLDPTTTLERNASRLRVVTALQGAPKFTLEIRGVGLAVNPQAPCSGTPVYLSCRVPALPAKWQWTLPLRGTVSSAEGVLERSSGKTRVSLRPEEKPP